MGHSFVNWPVMAPLAWFAVTVDMIDVMSLEDMTSDRSYSRAYMVEDIGSYNKGCMPSDVVVLSTDLPNFEHSPLKLIVETKSLSLL